MDCPAESSISDRESLRQWGHRAQQQRVPLSGTIELTRRCNLRCLHCYLGEQEAQWRLRGEELATEGWLSILDQMAEAGCLYLLITGGEPLLRPDFQQIYRRAKNNGLIVTVFSNGTTITDDVVALFRDLPPLHIEVSLYGASREVYEQITNVPGSHAKCIAGIERLARGGVKVSLKTMLLTLNRHEFGAIEEIARGYGARFRFDATVHACLNGDREPVALRVDPEEAVAVDFGDARRSEQWQDFCGRLSGIAAQESLYQCGAGITAFHIDPFGGMQMCLMAPELSYDLRRGSFEDGWRGALARARRRRAPEGHKCLGCELRALCGYCPGLLRLENGSEELPSEYLCALGKQRLVALGRSSRIQTCEAGR